MRSFKQFLCLLSIGVIGWLSYSWASSINNGGGGGGTVTDRLAFFGQRDPAGNMSMWNVNATSITGFLQQADAVYATHSNTGTPFSVLHYNLPATWTGNLDLDIHWMQNQAAPGGAVVQFDMQTSCFASGSSISAPFTYNSAQSVVPAVQVSQNLVITTQLALTTTGCSAGNELFLKVSRNNTVASNFAFAINVAGFVLTVRHT